MSMQRELAVPAQFNRLYRGEIDGLVVFATSCGVAEQIMKSSPLFSFIGAVPRTEWLPPEIEKDARGFVRQTVWLPLARKV